VAASITIRHGGAQRTVTSVRARHLGALRTIRTIKVMHGGTLRTVYTTAAPLAVNITPTTSINFGPSSTVTSEVVTATATGGEGAKTYEWEVVSHTDASEPTISSPSSASTAFTQTGVTASESAVFRVTVTDSEGATATDTISVSFERSDI
jgi:hypothetical protein